MPVARNLQSQILQNSEIGDIHMNYNMKECGKRIRQLRAQCGYIREELANTLNIDRSTLSRIELGARGCSLDLLIQLSIVCFWRNIFCDCSRMVRTTIVFLRIINSSDIYRIPNIFCCSFYCNPVILCNSFRASNIACSSWSKDILCSIVIQSRSN